MSTGGKAWVNVLETRSLTTLIFYSFANIGESSDSDLSPPICWFTYSLYGRGNAGMFNVITT